MRLKLCIDEETVSLNALELFTREPEGEAPTGKGLEKAVRRVLDEIAGRWKMQQSQKINDEIVSELAEVKKMLDVKSQQLAKQEKQLQKREREFLAQQRDWVRKIDAEYQGHCKK